MFSSWPLAVAVTLLVTLTFCLIKTKYRADLRKIPGPFLASISNIDRIWSCALGKQMNYHIDLHASYGPLVRVGPYHVCSKQQRDPETLRHQHKVLQERLL